MNRLCQLSSSRGALLTATLNRPWRQPARSSRTVRRRAGRRGVLLLHQLRAHIGLRDRRDRLRSQWSALAEPNADIYNFRSTQLFANAYYALDRGSSWTPYVGAGAGLARLDFGFYAAFPNTFVMD